MRLDLPLPPPVYAEGLRFEATEPAPGVRVFVQRTTRFKTLQVRCYVLAPLRCETVTPTALIPFVLRRGCRKFPTQRRIVQHLDRLYGASFGVSVQKIGDRQVLEFSLEWVADRFLPGRADTLQGGLDFLSRILHTACREGDGFRRDYVEQERTNLAHYIRELKDDPGEYAVVRCMEELCGGDPHGLFHYGRAEEALRQEPGPLRARHETLLRTHPIWIFVVGDVQAEPLARAAAGAFRRPRPDAVVAVPSRALDPVPGPPKVVRESHPVEQARIVCAFRTGVPREGPERSALSALNGVLGGLPNSRLFRNVRERDGLAYAIHSGLDFTKGVLLVHAGVDPPHAARVCDLIAAEIAALRRQPVPADELASVQRNMLQSLRGLEDAPRRKITIALEHLLDDRFRSVEELDAAVRALRPEDLQRAAERVRLDTTFILAPDPAAAASPAATLP